MARFSVIIPVYNVKLYLRECLDSVLSQDFYDFEICLVDDGSSDGSERLCDEYASKDKRIKLHHQANGGVSVARNKALEMATGEYIWFVDADDYILPGALKYIDLILKKSGSDTVFFGERKFDNSSTPQYDSGSKDTFLASHVCYCNPLMLFQRDIISTENIRFTTGIKMGEDLEFQYKYLLHCVHPVAIPYNFYYIRTRSGSASRSGSSVYNDFLGCRRILSNMMDYLEHLPDRGHSWMGRRLAERLKCYMKSASKLSDINRKQVQSEVCKFVKDYRALGYKDFYSVPVRLALIDVRLYYMLYKLLLTIARHSKNRI